MSDEQAAEPTPTEQRRAALNGHLDRAVAKLADAEQRVVQLQAQVAELEAQIAALDAPPATGEDGVDGTSSGNQGPVGHRVPPEPVE